MSEVKLKLKRTYVPYWEWEDWQSGMWRKLPKDQEEEFLRKAIDFTGDHVRYGEAMKEVVWKWNRTMLNSLTNTSINRRAFLGHCAVQMKINCPEYITRMAWKELTDEQRYLADKVAQETIDYWIECYERKDSRIHRGVAVQVLLQWDS